MPNGRPRTEKERKERHKRLHGNEPPKERLHLRWRRGGRGRGRGRYIDEWEADIKD